MDINTWFEWHRDDEDYIGSPELEELYSGGLNSASAAELWAEIANGDADIADALMWVQTVAKRVTALVVEASGSPSSERERAALRAIGFSGPMDVYSHAKQWMKLHSTLGVLSDNGEPLPIPRKTTKQWMQELQDRGYLLGVMDKTAINLINMWRKELDIE